MHGARVRLGIFVFAFVLVGMAGKVERAVAGGQESASGVPTAATAQALEATPSSVRFENVPVGELYTQMVRLTNQANARVRIANIVCSTPELAISGVSLPLEIEPGAIVNFTIGYKPQTLRNFVAHVSLETDASPTPLEIDVTASAESKEFGLAVDQTNVDFGVVAIGQKATRELELENRGNANVAISKISASSGNFKVIGGAGLELGPGQKTSVRLEFDATKAGNRQGIISVFSGTPGSHLQIVVSGTGALLSAHSVELKWEANLTSVAGYNIYRSTEADGSYAKLEASPVGTASYTDTGLAAGQTYFYRIMAVDGNNIESDSSEQISVTVPRD